MFLFDLSAKIKLVHGKYMLEYAFDDNDTTISHVCIYKEDPKGLLDYDDKKYEFTIVGAETTTTSDKRKKVEELIK